MTDAYVMLNCELGAEAEIIEKLKELEEVKDVFETIGTHDMMVKLQADNFEKIREIVSWSIQKLPKVRSTATLIKKRHLKLLRYLNHFLPAIWACNVCIAFS